MSYLLTGEGYVIRIAAQAYMATLSFELAAKSIAAATTPLLTERIKAAWIAKLQSNLFLIP